jgi:hypothetical protein
MALLSSSGLNNTPTKSEATGPSDLAQPYAKDILSKSAALTNNPAPAYTGDLTSGTSDYQAEAWKGLSNLTLPKSMNTATNNLNTIQDSAQNTKFDPNSINSYMNSYLQGALDPQIAEARRQAQIQKNQGSDQLIKSGAYGGGRQAIMESEANRNLLTNIAGITGKGYYDAYDNAMKAAQFNSDLGLKGLQAATTANQAAGNIGSQQAQYGLENLKALSTAGNTQQAQEQAALNAKYNQYLDQRNYPQTLLANQANLIKGIGGSQVSSYDAAKSALQQTSGAVQGVTELISNLKAAGKDVPFINNVLKQMGINPETLDSKSVINPDPVKGNVPAGYTYDAKSNTLKKDGQSYVLDGAGRPLLMDQEAASNMSAEDLAKQDEAHALAAATWRNTFDASADDSQSSDASTTDYGPP